MATTKSKDSKRLAQCIKCKHSTLKQWMENPIIAICHIRHERFVAACDRQCTFFELSGNPNPEITHYDEYEEEENF